MPEKKGVVPRLRFPEFRDAGPWEVRSIEQLASKIAQGGTPKTSVPEYWNGGIPWITPAEMGDDALHHYTETTLRAISRKGLENSSAELLPANSVIISSRAPIGYVTINKVEMATNQGCKGIIPKRDTYHEFLYFSLLVARQRLNNLGAGAGFKEISTSTLKAFQIPVPKLPEQQKIADCLSSLDEVIVLEARKLEALKAHKKGLMQQLFPREGETTPRLRFPEFRDAGPWEVKRLGEVCEINNGSSNAQDHVDAGEYPLFDRSLTVKRSNTYLFDCEAVIIPGEGSEFSPRYYKGKFDLHQRAYALTQFNVEGKFVFFLMDRWKARLAEQAVKSTVLSLRMPTLENFRITIPSKPEQQKIADCLSSLDEMIELQAKRLEALKQHKKGLMQQLFPQEVD